MLRLSQQGYNCGHLRGSKQEQIDFLELNHMVLKYKFLIKFEFDKYTLPFVNYAIVSETRQKTPL